MSSITAANAVFTLSIDTLFNNPQTIAGFATDDIYSAAATVVAEGRMGADGEFTGGLVFTSTAITYMLQGDSPSCDVFDSWYNQQLAYLDVYFASGQITLNSLGKKFNLVKGLLTSWQVIPNARRVLEPRPAVITWQRISVAPSNVLPAN